MHAMLFKPQLPYQHLIGATPLERGIDKHRFNNDIVALFTQFFDLEILKSHEAKLPSARGVPPGKT